LIGSGHSDAATIAELKTGLNESWANLLELLETRKKVCIVSFVFLPLILWIPLEVEGLCTYGVQSQFSLSIRFKIETYVQICVSDNFEEI